MEPSSLSRPVIIASRADAASINIAENLIQDFQFSKRSSSNDEMALYSGENVSLTIIDEVGILAKPENIQQGATPLVFASKHMSTSGKPALGDRGQGGDCGSGTSQITRS